MSREETATDDSLYPIAVLIDELRNEDVQVRGLGILALFCRHSFEQVQLNPGPEVVLNSSSSARTLKQA